MVETLNQAITYKLDTSIYNSDKAITTELLNSLDNNKVETDTYNSDLSEINAKLNTHSAEIESIKNINTTPTGIRWYCDILDLPEETSDTENFTSISTIEDSTVISTAASSDYESAYTLGDGTLILIDSNGTGGYLSFTNDVNEKISSAGSCQVVTVFTDVSHETNDGATADRPHTISMFTSDKKGSIYPRYNFNTGCFEIVKLLSGWSINLTESQVEILYSVPYDYTRNAYRRLVWDFSPTSIVIYDYNEDVTSGGKVLEYNFSNSLDDIFFYPTYALLYIKEISVNYLFDANENDCHLNKSNGDIAIYENGVGIKDFLSIYFNLQ